MKQNNPYQRYTSVTLVQGGIAVFGGTVSSMTATKGVSGLFA